MGEDGGEGDGAGDDGGGGLERVGQGAPHLLVLRHGGHHGLQQSGLEGGVPLEQPEGGGEVLGLGPHHGAGEGHHLGPGQDGREETVLVYLVVVHDPELYGEE